MQVILLAAGRSNRVKPIEDKNFIKFCGKFLIEWQLEALKEAGFDDILIVANGLNLARIQNFVEIAKDFENFPKNIQFCNQEDLDLGMAGAVIDSEKLLSSKEALIISSNDVVDIEAYKMILDSIEEDCEAAMIGYQVKEYFPGGYLKVSDSGYVEDIIEKPEPSKVPSNMINLVIHYFSNVHDLIEILKIEKENRSKDDIYERAISKLIKKGFQIKALPYDGFWQALKYPWHIFHLKNYFFEKLHCKLLQHKGEGENWIASDVELAETAVIKGKVIIESGSKIFDHAVINGPVYIGKNCIVANNALVRDTMIGDNCVIGYATEVARSHLSDHVWTHSNYIGDSIIGSNVSFGAGAVTGNLRLDEENIKFGEIDSGFNKLGLITGDNIRCGINVSFMPGLKIGSNSVIAAGIVISEDIAEDVFVKAEPNLKIYKNKIKVENKRQEAMKKLK